MTTDDPANPSAPAKPLPVLEDFVEMDDVRRLIDKAREEDMGRDGVDVTSACFVPPDLWAVAQFRSRQAGRLTGARLLPMVASIYDGRLRMEVEMADGAALNAGDVVATVSGPLRAILAMERIALNFMTHLSGVASLTAQFVAAVEGTSAKIYDTRKTIPGLRGLEKYAVACGGGCNHRMGLHDAVLIKDNHLADTDEPGGLAAALRRAIRMAKRWSPKPKFIEIEVDTLDQLKEILPCGPDIVLLDNMSLADMREAVAIRDRLAAEGKHSVDGKPIALEASGGVMLERVGAIAKTGVERIAVGALTHSAPSLDMGLDLQMRRPSEGPAQEPEAEG